MRQQTGQKLSKHRLSLSFYGQYIYQGYFCESWNSGPSELTSFRRQKSKKREKERMRKSARHICRTVKRQRRLGVCLFRYLRAAVCLNCLPNLPFYPCCTTASLATNVIRRVGSCISAVRRISGADLFVRKVSPHYIRVRLPQSRDSVVAKALVRNFVDAIPHSRRYTRRICTFRSSPDNYEISRCVSPFVFFPNNGVYRQGCVRDFDKSSCITPFMYSTYATCELCGFLVIATNTTTDDRQFQKEI